MIKLKHVYKDYKFGENEIHALQDIDLEINKGEFVCVAGPSGSGKSTLLNLIGLLDQPSKGEVCINGISISNINDKERAQLRLYQIGFVFQNFNLIPVFSVFENIEYPMVLKKIPFKKRKERINEILSEVGLSYYAKQRPRMLSGGQQQRVAIARALVGNPEIILADEPTANLDSKTGSEILDLMLELNRRDKVTFVFATHDPKVMERADSIIHLSDGKIGNE